MVEAPLLRLLVLVNKAAGLSPGQRFRLEQWAPHLAREHGITLDFVVFESPQLTELLHAHGRKPEKAALVLYDFLRRAIPVAKARSYDAVVVFREASLIGPAIWERAIAALGVPMLFDFDDAIWDVQISKANGIFSRLHFYGKTKTIIAKSRGISAGNAYLASYARQFCDNVFIVPTSIELAKYPVLPESTSDRFVVSWSGSLSTLELFETARPALEELAKKRPLTVKVICNAPPDRPIAGAENVFVKWSEQGEAEALADCHVGVMPLPDTAFTRGKCGLKALQYMGVGRPVVISPVGMNVDLVQTGENGILASTTEEWVAALESLAESAALRARLGAAGRATVEGGYSATIVAGKFANAVRQTLASVS